MRLLLDTHTFLWFVFGSVQLSPTARVMIEDSSNEKVLSVASVWEVAIKVGIGKIGLTKPVEDFFSEQLSRSGIRLLPIELRHAARVSTLPLHHRDPFDRLLVAQSLSDGLPLVSVDSVLDAYGIDRRW
jgi:PIN domain nuclease of toxin-antitoxin system